ncbi:MAG TPA: hypothetical protein VF526_14000 [Solirubrobacteraceae bacterium]
MEHHALARTLRQRELRDHESRGERVERADRGDDDRRVRQRADQPLGDLGEGQVPGRAVVSHDMNQREKEGSVWRR